MTPTIYLYKDPIVRQTKKLNKEHKARNREANLAARKAANQQRAAKGGPGWQGKTNDPAPVRPRF